jgi:hypothetical protein
MVTESIVAIESALIRNRKSIESPQRKVSSSFGAISFAIGIDVAAGAVGLLIRVFLLQQLTESSISNEKK